MPDWKMHVHTCEKALEKFKVVNASDFIFGGVLPDTPWMDSKEACKDGTLKCDLHCYLLQDTDLASMPNYYKFLKENKEFINRTDLGKGMLMHLILDAVVNKNYNRVTTELGNSEFDTELADGTIHHTVGFDRKVEEKYEDIHAYESMLCVRFLNSSYMSEEVKNELIMLECNYTIDDVIRNINNRIATKHDTRNVVFTFEQYEGMVDDAIKIFIDLGNISHWHCFD